MKPFQYLYLCTILQLQRRFCFFLGGGVEGKEMGGGEYHIMTFAFIYMYIALIQKACLKHIKDMFKVYWFNIHL